jgi:hypothetical protein
VDYAFAVEDPDNAAVATFFEFYDGRAKSTKKTTVLRTLSALGAPSLEGLASHLNGLPAADKPIGDVFIGSHGNETGWLEIRITSILPVGEVDFDTLTQFGSRLALQAGTTTPPSAGKPGTTIRFRACRIGQADPFMQLLKKSFGGRVKVSAAKHFFEFGGGTTAAGATYAFLLSVPAAERFKDRKKAVVTFRDHKHPTTGLAFRYYDGSAIPKEKWEEWMPKKAPAHKTRKSFRFDLATAKSRVNLNTEFRAERTVTPDAVPYSGPRLQQPAARAKALAHLKTLPGYQPSATNPYPIYSRNGFDDLDSFVNGHTWTSTQVKGQDALLGARMEYTLLVPLFDPATGRLLHNLMPDDGVGPPDPHTGLDETNSNLFWNQ